MAKNKKIQKAERESLNIKDKLLEALKASAPEGGGSRNGKVVLVESRLVVDPETSQSFTIKRYHSEKEYLDDGQWRHKKITLSPDNKAFKDIVLKNVSEDDFRVVAEFIEVLA